MTLGFEVALPLGAIAFYLYDSTLLLHGNELLFVRHRGTWRAVGGGNLTLFGKRACLPAPLMPWCLVFRTLWSERASASAAQLPAAWPSPDFARALAPLRIVSTVLLALLFGALPLASLLLGSGLVLLGVFGAYYLLVLAALAYLYLRRDALALQRGAYWALALDVFACAPFAVNLVRRITLRQTVPVDALAFSAARLAPREQVAASAFILARVEEYLASAQPDSTEARDLTALRARLTQEVACAG